MNTRTKFHQKKKFLYFVSVFAVLALLLAACQPSTSSNSNVPVTGSTEVSGVATSVSQGVATVVPTMEAMAPTVGAVATVAAGVVSNGQVAVANNATLGNILVDSRGFTLYTFKNDEPGGKSTCSGQCLVNWPPMLVAPGTQPSAGTGVDATKLSTITRDDGLTQVAYNNMPLYFFIKDTAAGNTNGEGVGSVWFTAKP